MDTFTLIKNAPEDSNAIPLILVHDSGGTVFSYFLLGSTQRHVYAISYPNWESGDDFEGGLSGLARFYCTLIRDKVPKGRILLGGWSFGALTSLEICHQLAADQDHQVAGLVMIDSPNPVVTHGRAGIQTKDLPSVMSSIRLNLRDKILRSMEICGAMIQAWTPPEWENGSSCPPAVLLRSDQFVPVPNELESRATVDLAREDEHLGWEAYEPLKFKEIIQLRGRHHFNIFRLETIDEITKHIAGACDILLN